MFRMICFVYTIEILILCIIRRENDAEKEISSKNRWDTVKMKGREGKYHYQFDNLL